MRKAGWGLLTLLATLVAAYALANALAPRVRTPFVNEIFSTRGLRALGHLGAGSVAIVAGALQFSTRLRFGAPRVHRVIGRIYLAAVLISGVAGGLLAPWSSGGVTAHFGFGLLAVLWLGTSTVAWPRVRAGDYPQHRAWIAEWLLLPGSVAPLERAA